MREMSVKFLCCGLSKFVLREEQEKFVIAKKWFTLWWQSVDRGGADEKEPAVTAGWPMLQEVIGRV